MANDIINLNHRKILKTGGMRYVSLPAKFLKENNLQTDDLVDISDLKKVVKRRPLKK